MNISFTGIRNTSCLFYTDPTDKGSKIRFLNTQLKDDENGNDLTEYKKLIAKHKEFQNPYYSNFVNLTTMNHHGSRVVKLNGVIIPETDEYLPLFSFVGKLAKKISKADDDKFITDYAYLKSPYVNVALLLDKNISYEMNQPIDELIPKIHDTGNIKRCAQMVTNDVTACMMDYFA